ncbi:MAG: hypothetical protein B6D56_06660 [Candidatus Omnitrophica bacterium 4484_70.1]|nr:MAG: hypothetical protein B6D56_06660 [Candidatus Omnitrophica bacterium 4484_70.1]
MKVLAVIKEYPPYIWGGGGEAGGRIINYASSQYGIEFTVIANQPKLSISKEVENNITIYRVPALGSSFLTKLPSFSLYASILTSKLQKHFDLIYATSPLYCKIKRPLIIHFQGTRYGEYLACKKLKKTVYAFLNRIYVLFDKIMLKKAEGIIILSQNMVEEINAIGGAKKEITVIPNGVDKNLFKPLGPRNFNSQEKKILYVGRLDLRKGIDTLFYAFQKIIKKIKAKLVIVGEGKEKSKLISLAKSLSLPVDFWGKVEHKNLPQVYNQADLFVLTSLYEPFGMVALEAMACGTPTVISDTVPIEGIPRFSAGNVDELSNLLLEILPSQDKLQKLSQTCFEIAQKYSWEKIIFKIIEFFKKFK